jgi:predicted alpha/beta-hydrolase family hydrolase
MLNQEISIPVGETKNVSGVVSVPEQYRAGKGASVILAHGAGNDKEHPLIVTLAQGIAEAGFLAIRFNFPYREQGRRAPDPQDILVLTWESVYRFLKSDPRYGTGEIIAAGKSMGGRVASQMVADGLLPATRLIFLGYPLHPPGRKERLRDAHLYRIRIPMLFFVGSRDPLCDLTQLESVLARLQVPSHLETIDGGDHSFRLRKSANTPQQEVYDYILHQTVEWLRHQYGQSNPV